MTNTLKSRVVKGQKVMVVALDRLGVDASYQREVKPGHEKIMSCFNKEALGLPLVAQREDGSLWLVDGQQRVTALRKMNWKDCRCEVFASRGTEHEAQVYKLVNLNRTKLNAAEQFRALLAAHDETAWAIKDCVEKAGYKLGLSKQSKRSTRDGKVLTSLSTLERVAREWGVEHIHFALKTTDAVWPGDSQATGHIMLGGLATFYHRRKGAVDMDRLIPRLRLATPHKILYTASQRSLSGGTGRWGVVADLIEDYYRKRQGAKS